MNSLHLTSSHVPLMIAGVAAILLGSAALKIAPSAGSPQSSLERNDIAAALENIPETSAAPGIIETSLAGAARAKARCDECGEIESMRLLAAVGDTPAVYEIKVRMRDGSTLVSNEARPASWRPGEPTIFIAGGTRPGRTLPAAQ